MIKKLALTATLAASAALPACNIAHAAEQEPNTCVMFLDRSSPLPMITVPKSDFSTANGVVSVKGKDGSVTYYFNVQFAVCK
jgi:hypothetical protein